MHLHELRPTVRHGLFIASALALVLGTQTALAQPYGPYHDEDGYYDSSRETVEVIAPRFPHRTSRGGAIEQVSYSREVRAYDLDLRTPWGADELRSRIRFAARALCEKIDRSYAVIDDGRSCYYEAVERAMPEADAAIAEARGYSYAR